MSKVDKKKKRLLVLLVIIVCLCAYLYWENNHINLTEFQYESSRIPAAFDGFVIAQVSDLHNKNFGEYRDYLIEKLRQADPDIIVVTGDVVDRRRYDLDIALDFVKGASKIAPVYYVSGNHEAWLDEFGIAKVWLIEKGAIFMDDTLVTIKKGDSEIKLIGLSDPDFLTTDYDQGTDVSKATKQLAAWADEDGFKILLSHRPELMNLYDKNNIDLVFAGHTHGGQVRLPFLGGVVAPDQGFFPDYTAGRYDEGSTTMYVSKGLGNSLFPIRINDAPEIVVVRLERTVDISN
jgi:hypothetical protein